MKKTLSLAVALLCAAGLRAATLDGLAAKVNDAVITVGDVMNEVHRLRARGAAQDDDFKTVYSNAVESLVTRRLILAMAAQRKLEMQEWLVDNRVREIVKDSFEGDMNKLHAELAKSRVPETEWRNQIRDDMIVNGMRYQMVDKDINPSPSAMRREFETHRARYAQDARTTVSVILLRPPRDDKTASVSTRGAEILGLLDKGEDFGVLAKIRSSDSHAKDGGVWKDIKPEEAFRPEIAETIAKLKVGEYSQLIDLDGWGFIVRKDAESGAKKLTFAEAYDQILRNLRKDESARRYEDWVRRLRADAFIHIYPMPDEK